MQRSIKLTTVALMVTIALALGAGRALAATNWWGTNTVGSYSGDYTNAVHWTPAVPGTADDALFTNNQSVAYTVQFTTSVTNKSLKVFDDTVNFDLNGYRAHFDTPGWGYDITIGTNKNVATTVKFYSTSVATGTGGNTISTPLTTSYGGFGPMAPYNGNPLGDTATRLTTVTVDDSGGFPVTLDLAHGPNSFSIEDANVYVSGFGTVFRVRYGANLNGNLVVSDDALLDLPGYAFKLGGGRLYATTTVVNATMKSTGGYLGTASSGWESEGMLILSNNATWTDSATVNVGFSSGGSYWTSNHSGRVVMDGSTFVGQKMVIGGYGDGWGVGKVQVLNGSSMTLSNGLFLNATNWTSGARSLTNTLVLNGATIKLGGAVLGTLTNQGIMKASGTITGLGSGPSLVRNERILEVGSSIGQLTLNNVNLELAAGSETFWEFGDTGLDQIVINGGSASVLGSNLFSLASGAAPLGPYKYGLGTYDFITSSNITWNPQYDNLTNILASAGLVQNLDYRWGMVDVGGGLQALRLEFVPEPSTVMLLLVGGGLMLRSARRRKPVRQRGTASRVVSLVVVVALALGAGRALAATNYWSDLGSGYSGDYTNITTVPHWTTNGVAAGVPTSTDVVAFTNKQQSSAYTVQFTSSQTNGALNVWDDAVNFDLNGNIYKGNGAGWYTYLVIGDTQTVATTVKFFSTSDTNVVGGNTARLSNPGVLGYAYVGPKGGDVHLPSITRNTTVTVDDSGGFPITLECSSRYFIVRDADLVVSGSGTVLRANYNASLNGNVLVTDGALLDISGNGSTIGGSAFLATTTVANATMKTLNLALGIGSPGWSSQGTLILTNTAIWTDSGTVKVGFSSGGSYVTSNHSGQVLIDGSTFVGQNMAIGGQGDYWGVGKVEVLNGSSMTLSNGLFLNATNWTSGARSLTNTLVLNG
ncbi:PEP-CTERM sorting domain-containing protein, partial [bacterium]|nr:PEP-CTERM sorting domain-containing protein [bacterium]